MAPKLTGMAKKIAKAIKWSRDAGLHSDMKLGIDRVADNHGKVSFHRSSMGLRVILVRPSVSGRFKLTMTFSASLMRRRLFAMGALAP